ncbi:MAG: T9SS type A sorting domain-containing protein [Bacteroidetes bacterium]|nr:T9SS type A sorting domain-containing protein [Bacteroidota bacterium]
MKTIYVLLIAFAFTSMSQAQSLSQTVIANAGATISGASNTLSFTLGEPVIGAINNSESLGQGFWLGAIEGVVLSSGDFTLDTKATVYPNPANNQLTIEFTDMMGQDFSIIFFDIQGRAVLRRELRETANSEILDLDSLSRGTYLMVLTTKATQQSKTFKIIKQ